LFGNTCGIVCTVSALLALAFGAPAQTASSSGQQNHLDLVNVFTGTSNSRWMQFPGATVPMGLVKLSPDNQGNVWNGGYEYTIASISGFSFLHSFGLSSMSVMPLIGPIETEPGHPKLFPGPSDGPFGSMWTSGYRSRIRKDTETGKPGYYAVDLVDARTRVELTATTRTGWMRFHFPTGGQIHLLVDFAAPAEEKAQLLGLSVKRVSATEIEGSLAQRNGYSGEFTIYFICQSSQPFIAMNAWQTGEYTGSDTNNGVDWRRPRTIKSDVTEIESKQPGGVWLDFSTTAEKPVVVRTGVSLTGLSQARENLRAESAPNGFDFDSVARAASASWKSLLDRVDVEGGTQDERIKLYTNLYRMYSCAHRFSHLNLEGNTRRCEGRWRQHGDPMDGRRISIAHACSPSLSSHPPARGVLVEPPLERAASLAAWHCHDGRHGLLHPSPTLSRQASAPV
jgi:putative alpha-1,2-mannosidase